MLNKEKWSKGKHDGTVVSDTRTKMNIPDGRSHNDVDFYGGYLVAESIPKEEYVNLIAAAPKMYVALHGMLSDYEDQYGENYCECDSSVGLTCNACHARSALALAGHNGEQPKKGGESV